MFYKFEWKIQAANTLDYILQVCCVPNMISSSIRIKKNKVNKVKNLCKDL